MTEFEQEAEAAVDQPKQKCLKVQDRVSEAGTMFVEKAKLIDQYGNGVKRLSARDAPYQILMMNFEAIHMSFPLLLFNF